MQPEALVVPYHALSAVNATVFCGLEEKIVLEQGACIKIIRKICFMSLTNAKTCSSIARFTVVLCDFFRCHH